MRTLVSLGLLALSLGSFTNIALAGNVEDCEVLKNDHTPALYGLCIAWHNAGSDNARDRILDKYNEKAGPDDPPMPGTGVACPCWDDAKLAEAVANGTPISCQTTEETGLEIEFALYDDQLYQFFADVNSCFQVNPDSSFVAYPDLSPEETQACHDDILTMIDMAFDGFVCDGT